MGGGGGKRSAAIAPEPPAPEPTTQTVQQPTPEAESEPISVEAREALRKKRRLRQSGQTLTDPLGAGTTGPGETILG